MKQYPDLRPRALSGTLTGVSTIRRLGYRRRRVRQNLPREPRALLRVVYRRLRARFGHAGWWPGDSPFEVCVGAILVQNTAWANVERTLDVLRRRRRLSFRALDGLSASRLAPLLRPSGTFRVKARRLRAFLDFLASEYGGRVEAMRADDPARLRRALLAVSGIGPETADSIALYAGGHPVFVIDAYTRRVFSRLGLLRGRESYAEAQRLFQDRLPRDAALYNDYHAQVVRLGKDVCRVRPRCAQCPVEDLCPKHDVIPRALSGRRPRNPR
jgi:endonuclease III related protein